MTVTPYVEQQVAEHHPRLRFGYIILRAVTIESVPPRFKKRARALEEAMRTSQPSVAAARAHLASWKEFVRSLGVTSDDDLPAPNWLYNRIMKGGQIPKLFNVVDVANFVALSTGLPVGVFDLGKISGTPRLSLAKPREMMTPLFEGRAMHVPENEVIYRDESGIFSRYAKDSDRTKITAETSDVLCVVDAHAGVSDFYLDSAVSLAVECFADTVHSPHTFHHAIAKSEV